MKRSTSSSIEYRSSQKRNRSLVDGHGELNEQGMIIGILDKILMI